MPSEHKIQEDIETTLSKHHCTVFRTNVGKVLKADGSWFNTGLPKGHPDLYGFRWVDNQIFYIEVKSEIGKPEPVQINFHNMLMSHNIIHGIARSEHDALMIVEKGLVGYGYPV